MKLTVEDKEAYAGENLEGKPGPVEMPPLLAIPNDRIATNNGANDNEDVYKPISNNNTDVSILIGNQLRHGDEGNAADTTGAAVQTETGDEHDVGRGHGANDVAEGTDDAGHDEEPSSAEEIRVGGEEEDGDGCDGGDAGDDPGGELGLAELAEKLGGNGGRCGSCPGMFVSIPHRMIPIVLFSSCVNAESGRKCQCLPERGTERKCQELNTTTHSR